MTEIQFKTTIDVELIQNNGTDQAIVAAARVSTLGGMSELHNLDQEKTKEHLGLIRYLMKHRHGTPFEHGSMTFRVCAPIFVWREWHRHRIGFSYNEQSGRYSKLEPIFWIPPYNRKMIPIEGFKPARPLFMASSSFQYEQFCNQLKIQYQEIYELYEILLDKGFAKEVSRAILPVGIYSTCWVTCNPRSMMSFLSLRTHHLEAKFVSYPQAEIEEAARKCEDIFAHLFPMTYQAFVENGRVSP